MRDAVIGGVIGGVLANLPRVVWTLWLEDRWYQWQRDRLWRRIQNKKRGNTA